MYCIHKFLNKNTLFLVALCKAGVAELVDALDLGSSAAKLGGSSPFTRTFQIHRFNRGGVVFIWLVALPRLFKCYQY
jgi:hypothetical protein